MAIPTWISRALAPAAALLLAPLLTGQATAAPSPSPAVPASLAGSVDYLSRDYHIPASEALRRLDLQRRAPGLADRLSRTMPDVYGGMWLDQDHGGVLRIGMTRPELLKAAVRSVADAAHIRPYRVAHSRRELEAAADGIRATLTAPTDSVTVDDVRNTVILRTANSAVRTRALAAAGGLVTVQAPTKPVSYNDCEWSCGPPMRGALELDDYNSGGGSLGYCTMGFNTVGSNGWVYTTTAGHCFPNGSGQSKHNGTPVGYVDLHMWSHNYPTDGALMPYVTSPQNYAVYWKPNNWVIAGSNTQFPIRGSYTYDQIGVGWAVCMDGATSGHRCGHVTGKDGGIITDICEQHGDSGGPLFSEVDNKAYGMVDWDTTTDNSCPSGYRSYHTAIQSLYNYAWGYQHITFKVKTS